jgi:hypothetical protein
MSEDRYIATPENTVSFVRHRPDGSIDMYGTMAKGFVEDHIDAGEPYLLAEGRMDTHYVGDGVLMDKTPGQAVLDGMTIKSLPIPAWVTIEGVTYEVTDGEAELEFTQPGTYAVQIRSVSQYPQTIEVTV